MVKRIGMILFFMVAAVGAVREPPLQGLAFADVPPCPPECVTDTMEIVTWYPSPYNEYEELRLYPISVSNSECNDYNRGLMYYDSDDDKIRVCKGTLLGWQEFGYWQLSGTGVDIYNTNSGNVGIGTTNPTTKLDVSGAVRLGNLAANPPGANGALYYNTATNSFMGFRNEDWQPFGGEAIFGMVTAVEPVGELAPITGSGFSARKVSSNSYLIRFDVPAPSRYMLVGTALVECTLYANPNTAAGAIPNRDVVVNLRAGTDGGGGHYDCNTSFQFVACAM